MTCDFQLDIALYRLELSFKVSDVISMKSVSKPGPWCHKSMKSVGKPLSKLSLVEPTYSECHIHTRFNNT